MIVGDADPLLSDSQLLVENLRDSGVAVEEHVFAGMPHGFSMVPFLTDGLRSLDLAGAFLRTRAGA